MTIEEAIEWYEECDEQNGYEGRRYGACIGHLDGVVAIADEDGENGSSLEMYMSLDFIKWMSRAKALFEQGGNNLDMVDCLYEFKPEPVVELSH